MFFWLSALKCTTVDILYNYNNSKEKGTRNLGPDAKHQKSANYM